ncbi:MAG: ABC transporter ATP-binding protein [Magnetococcales bacterium]|nr:ABC transporter ATP-binding protein [Magnetococcales bacterium]NGZ26531.1 ABC transporter ATP-binding protein [Magnetococcales bacterium]
MSNAQQQVATGASLPEPWRSMILEKALPGESPLSWLETDLDDHLRYHSGVLVLTQQRIFSRKPGFKDWEIINLTSDMTLKRKDHAGAGVLELMDSQGRISFWRYTIGHSPAVRYFIERFNHREQPPVEEKTFTCPTCGSEMAEGALECSKCADKPVAPASSALFRLIQFAKPRSMAIFIGFAMTLTGTAAGLIPPYLTMPIMDEVLIPHQNGQPVDEKLVTFFLLGLLGSSLLAWLMTWVRTYIMAWVSERIGSDLRNAAYSHLQKLSLEYFGGKRTGDLISRIGTDTDQICTFLSLHLLDFVTDVLMIAMTVTILLSINPWLTLIAFIPLPVIAWLLHLVRERLRRGFKEGMRAWGEMTTVLADTIPGIRVVKAFAQENREVERFGKANDHVLEVNDRTNFVWATFAPMVTFCTEVGLLIVWGFGIYWVAKDTITVGVLTAFITYIGRFYTRLDSMSRIASITQRAAAGAQRLFDILDRVPSVPEPLNPVQPGRVKGKITFDKVGFRYGNRMVTHDISMEIQPGEMVGLVGPSGSGKSTLVNLVCRFYDVSEGAIRVDGHDIRSFPVSEYRRNIGLVLQEPFLFYGTIAENIAYGRPDASRAEVVAAARAARAHDFILRLPEGYDSLVGERGQSLSGGERQRISIARALLIDPQILILDEATSSVDTETEREIQEALDNLIQGRTTIAIAHRLSTLTKADRLVVLENGSIVEEGKHEDLLALDGTYARLYHAQERASMQETVSQND